MGRNEEHARRVSEGKARAREIRETWLAALGTGEVDVDHLVKASRREETRSLSNLLLRDILMTLPGWTTKTASEVLLQNGFGPKDNVQNIRKSQGKVELFKTLMLGTPGQWRPRPKMPEGWPFRGKLDDLLHTVERDARIASEPKLSYEDVARLHPVRAADVEEMGEMEEAPQESGDVLDDLNRLIEEHNQSVQESPKPDESGDDDAPTDSGPRSSGLSFFS